MWKHYWTTTQRYLRKRKGYALLNIVGLSTGMACCLLMLLYVQDELRYDRFHAHADRIYRVATERGVPGETRHQASSAMPTAPTLQAEYPAVIREAVRVRRLFQPVVAYEAQRFTEDDFFLVDSAFFSVFTFPLLRGDPAQALVHPASVVLSETAARRYFGEADPMGAVLSYTSSNGTELTLTVTGVAQDPPAQSHFRFDFLMPFSTVPIPFLDDWDVFVSNYTYLLLGDADAAPTLQAQLPAFVDRHVRGQLGEDYVFNLALQPLTDIRLHSNLAAEIAPMGNIIYVYLFGLLALFVLLIAAINFINLATAWASRRAREVGLRKAIGAQPQQLIQQFLGESLLLSMGAAALAVALVLALLPTYSGLAGKAWTAADVLTLPFVLGVVAGTLLIGLGAGSYPAFLLVRFRPITVLRSQVGAKPGSAGLRRGLVVFQFAVSTVLIICTQVVFDQVDYVQTKNLGFDEAQVVALPIDQATARQGEAVKAELLQHPAVVQATASLRVPGQRAWTYGIRHRADPENSMAIASYMVDHDFLDAYAIPQVAGRRFDRAFPSDSTAFILNETAVRQFGWQDPEEALGQPLSWATQVDGEVIGVVKDFHAESLHEVIKPMVFLLRAEYYYLSVRLQPDALEAGLAHLETTLAALAPQQPFEYFFIDQQVGTQYRSAQQLGTLFGGFSLLAILIACLGLGGLAAYTAERRTREMGVRRVFGASGLHVVALLSREFFVLMAVAFAVAAPLAYGLMQRWLQTFAYHTEVGGGVFLLAALLVVGITALTIGYQVLRTARTNPVEVLRHA